MLAKLMALATNFQDCTAALDRDPVAPAPVEGTRLDQQPVRRAKAATYWGPSMTESQCAVFHFDVKTMSARDAEGREPSPASDGPLVFDSLSEAERYSKDKIATTRGLGCRIYDRDGKILGTFVDPQLYERLHRQPSAKRNLLVGMVCLVIGAGLIGLDIWMEYRLLLGVLLGVRLLWAAAIKLIDGATGLKRHISKS
jgi:hypothetical protein